MSFLDTIIMMMMMIVKRRLCHILEEGAFGSRGGAFALLGAPLKHRGGAGWLQEAFARVFDECQGGPKPRVDVV